MDLPALETSVRALEKSLDSTQLLLQISTAVVVIGLIFEYWEPIRGILDEIRKLRFPFKKVLSNVGGLLVVLGVAGELCLQPRVSGIETRIRQETGQIEALLNREAGDAKNSATQAATAARVAKASAEEATEGAGKAKLASAGAKALASDARTQADDAGKRIGAIQSQEADLQNKVGATSTLIDSQRQLTSSVIASLSPRELPIQVGPGTFTSFDSLKLFAGTKVVFEVLTDAEARRAAQEIENVLHFAKWDLQSVTPNPELYSGFNDGVHVEYSQPILPTPDSGTIERTRRAAASVALYLLEHDWEADLRMIPANISQQVPGMGSIPYGTVKIVVGFKPNPLFEPDWVKESRENEKRLMEWESREREWENNRQGPPPPMPLLQRPESVK